MSISQTGSLGIPKNEDLMGKRIHILGVAGTLMGSFAAYLKKQGIAVTGSDQNIYPPMSDVLARAGVPVYLGYSAENLEKAQPDMVIVGNVIRKTNVEMEAVNAKDLPYYSLPSYLEQFILPHQHSIVVAGTHGKTTTSTLLTYLLMKMNLNPSYFIGGVPQDFKDSFCIQTPTDNQKPFMVLEGDEYDTAFFDKVPKFTHYLPKDVILTSIEFDHADIYKDMNAVTAAFSRLAEIIDPNGNMIVCAETETPLRVASESKANMITYGFGQGADSRATKWQLTPQGARFEWNHRQIEMSLNGKHNILNALACLTLIQARGLDVDAAISALKTFQGVKRRQEFYGQANGITLIDDFAHHPTAVKETLLAIRSKHPSARLLACFEPRSATSRRKVFQKAYSESFDLADSIHIAKPFDQTGIQDAELFSTEELIGDLKNRNKKAEILDSSQDGVKRFAKSLQKGDVVLVMSNGGFDGFLPKLLKEIQ